MQGSKQRRWHAADVKGSLQPRETWDLTWTCDKKLETWLGLAYNDFWTSQPSDTLINITNELTICKWYLFTRTENSCYRLKSICFTCCLGVKTGLKFYFQIDKIALKISEQRPILLIIVFRCFSHHHCSQDIHPPPSHSIAIDKHLDINNYSLWHY